MPQVVETEVLDAGTPLGLVPRRRAMVDALAGEGEAQASSLAEPSGGDIADIGQ